MTARAKRKRFYKKLTHKLARRKMEMDSKTYHRVVDYKWETT